MLAITKQEATSGLSGLTFHASAARQDHKVHILHRNGSKEDALTHDQCPTVSDAPLEPDFQRSDVRHRLAATISENGFFAIGSGFQPQSGGNVGWHAQEGGTRAGKCLHLYGRQVRVAKIA